jgi:hypothetical protein
MSNLNTWHDLRKITEHEEAAQMSHLEIIHLRSSTEPLNALSSRIKESVRSSGSTAKVVTMYRRNDLETDVAIHIQALEGLSEKGPSMLGHSLASALRAYGMVEHTLWEEL